MASIDDILGTVQNTFGLASQGQWNLARGSFKTSKTQQEVIFFFETSAGEDRTQKTAIDQITDGGGRRNAKYEYPYRNGQALADLGRKGEAFTFSIKFFGSNYQQKFKNFIDVCLNSGESGTLVHPVRGSVIARFDTYEFIHKFDEWNAITIRATFLEDNTDILANINTVQTSQDSALRSALQFLIDAQSKISVGIAQASAAANLPSQIIKGMTGTLNNIISQASGLLGKLGSTFSSDSQIHSISQQASKLSIGVPALSGGTVSTGANTQSTLPPVYQVGFDPISQATINSNLSAFVNANQITTQQAVFNANQNRQAIAAAINEINNNLGNFGYDLIIEYRNLANQIQNATESCLATSQKNIVLYVVPRPMSIRKVAQNNGLDPDRQNDIEALNPYLDSVNFIPAGTNIIVPAS